MPRGGFHSTELRVQVLTLWAVQYENKDISTILDIDIRAVQNIVKRGKERGYNPSESLRVKLEFVEDGKRSGRPVQITEAIQASVIASVSADRSGREKSSEILAYEAGISHSSVLRILHKHGLVVAKPSWKPGLTEAARARRLEFCLAHQYWTLDDWMNVIFTDETSVVLGHRRGSVRVWRTVEDRHNRTCIRRRWKGASDFMVWGCFTYNQKGPLHIWDAETKQQRSQADREIEALNQELEPLYKEQWEMNTAMNRLHLRPNRGRIPKWNWNEKNGKLVRKGKGGVDWYRYQTEVLIPKLIPFAKECMIERPNTVVLEDGAPAHRHRAQQRVYNLHEVQKILDWPGNSPDLNAIEPAWAWLKKRTTSRGAPRDKKTGREVWIKAWDDLPQETIQHWIQRLIRHIQEVIQLEGGNEYKEGREDHDTRSWKGRRTKGQLSTRVDLAPLPEEVSE